MHRFERITPLESLRPTGRTHSRLKESIGAIEYALWSNNGRLPLEVKVCVHGEHLELLKSKYQLAGYKVRIFSLNPPTIILERPK